MGSSIKFMDSKEVVFEPSPRFKLAYQVSDLRVVGISTLDT
jgi:hypothetical protein